LLVLALLAGCDWGSKPMLPLNGASDAAAVDGADPTQYDVAPPPNDAAFDVPTSPDVPVATADASSPDAAPPPRDGSASDASAPDVSAPDASAPDGGTADDCRFVAARDGEAAPTGAVVVDGGYFANGRGEGCDPTPRVDGGADVTDADVTDASLDAPSDTSADAAEGGRP
jgi:hypothetical protein